MNKIIIDSGSTKADLAIVTDDAVNIITIPGINPVTNPDITFSEEIVRYIKACSQLIHYGAGVHGPVQKKILKSTYFSINDDMTVDVFSDLMGACRATASVRPGIVSILGTGSNSCVYDGQHIVDNVPSLGYILGDEGGGVHIGKELLKQYFQGSMPREISDLFGEFYKLDRDYVLNQVYRKKYASRYLAQHARFLSQVEGPWKVDLLLKVFREFVKLRICAYDNYQDYKLYFIGSIAFYYKDALTAALASYGLEIEDILKRPIESLVQFHKNNDPT